MSEIIKLKNKINTYIDNDMDEFALLIDGVWGSGKTFAIDKVIEQHNLDTKNKNKKMAYISLNGIIDMNDALNDFYAYTASRIVKFATKTISEIADNQLGTPFTKFVDKIECEKKIKQEFKTIIIDDIERCKCDIDSTVGFIDKLLKNKYKVILIMNSKEIGYGSDTKNKDLYEKIKEKIVGSTIIWKTTDSTIESIINTINESSFDIENLDILKKAFLSNYENFFIDNNGEKNINLRALKKTINHTINILKILNWNKENNKVDYLFAYTEIVKNVYIYFHYETYGKVTSDYNNPEFYKDMKSSIYKIDIKMDLLFIKEYFNNGLFFDKNKFNKELEILLTEYSELVIFFDKTYSEQDLRNIYNTIEQNLKNKKYPIFIFKTIIYSIIDIDKILNTNHLKQIIDIMCNLIKNDTNFIIYKINHYMLHLDKTQKKLIESLNDCYKEHNKDIFIKLINTKISNKEYENLFEIGEEYDYSYSEEPYYFEDIEMYKYFSNIENISKYFVSNNYDSFYFDVMYKTLKFKDKQNKEHKKQIEKIITYLDNLNEKDKAKQFIIQMQISKLKDEYKILTSYTH